MRDLSLPVSEAGNPYGRPYDSALFVVSYAIANNKVTDKISHPVCEACAPGQPPAGQQCLAMAHSKVGHVSDVRSSTAREHKVLRRLRSNFHSSAAGQQPAASEKRRRLSKALVPDIPGHVNNLAPVCPRTYSKVEGSALPTVGAPACRSVSKRR
jgi:hypothetical protein